MDGMSQKLEQGQAEVNKVIKGKEDVAKAVSDEAKKLGIVKE